MQMGICSRQWSATDDGTHDETVNIRKGIDAMEAMELVVMERKKREEMKGWVFVALRGRPMPQGP